MDLILLSKLRASLLMFSNYCLLSMG